jgi:hypothetical protein
VRAEAAVAGVVHAARPCRAALFCGRTPAAPEALQTNTGANALDREGSLTGSYEADHLVHG